MALSRSNLRWYGVDGAGKITSPLIDLRLHTFMGAITVGDPTDYAILALVNESSPAQSLTAGSVWISGGTGGVALAIGLSASGVVAKTSPVYDTATADSPGKTAPTGVTFSAPTSAGTLTIPTLASGQALGVWVRRTASSATPISPETNYIAVTGTSPI